MKLALNLAAIAAALALQTTLTSFVPQTAAIDLVLIVVVYLSLSFGPTTGLVAGTVAGLIQDSLSSGIMGIGGLAKTLVGFACRPDRHAVHRHRRRCRGSWCSSAPRLLHALVFMGLYVLLGLREFPDPYATVAGQAVGNAVVGVVGFQLLEWLPGFMARRRLRRPMRR